MALQGGAVTREALWNAFAERCRRNLHVVLAMSPVGEDLRRRCRNFPALVNNCTIDWFDPWPAQALQSVAGAFLQVKKGPGEISALNFILSKDRPVMHGSWAL